ncbi:MAG: efflux RND transporter permease subunit [Bacteroidia bacterium]
MWTYIARFILRNRLLLLMLLATATGFMGWHASQVRMSNEGNRLIPDGDPDLQIYKDFQKTFGIDGNIMVVGVQSRDLFELEFFNEWSKLTERIHKLELVRGAVSIANLPRLEKNQTEKKFDFKPIVGRLPQNEADLEAIRAEITNNKLYAGILLNPETNTTLMAVTFDEEVLNSDLRIPAVEEVVRIMDAFAIHHDVEVHYSGLPYVRTIFSTKVAMELKLFSVLAVLVTAFVLFMFFRSFYAVFFPILVVVVGAVWALGLIHLFGFKITLLSGLIPALIVVIGVPNCVYLLNKYHDEFRKHGNKVKALSRIIERIGIATLITNATTAIGFGVFYFTDSAILQEFGLVVAVSIMLVFVASIIIIPAVFAYLPSPERQQLRHLDNNNVSGFLNLLERIVIHHRTAVYVVTSVMAIVAVIGATRLQALSYIVDDLPRHDKVYSDLKFFEQHFSGVMPFELLIDTGRKGGAQSAGQLQKAEEVQQILSSHPEFGNPLSVVQLVKGANQAYFNGQEDYFRLPNAQERNFVLPYLIRTRGDNQATVNALTDSSRQIIRISMNVADVGTIEMRKLFENIKPRVDSVMEGTNNKVSYTGTSLIFLKGNAYLISSLISSLSLAFVIISIIMSLMFRSWKIIVISIVPNLFPLLVTAGAMGYLGVALKPSTVLIFSIAFGIAVDDSIHFLTKYRQELRRHNWDIPKTVIMALRETGASMVYTSIILFFGFIIFGASNFGGTVALGLMTSSTLIVAMLSNLLLLPTLILSFDRREKKRQLKLESAQENG